MSKQKGRGGKKQRYSIADIGGGDLTSQDMSTEKVLNFLIRGGLPQGEENDEVVKSTTTPPAQDGPLLNETSLPSRDEGEVSRIAGSSSPRRSLDHLFNRANKSASVKEKAPPSATITEALAESGLAEEPRPVHAAEEDLLTAKPLIDIELGAAPRVTPSSPLIEATTPPEPSDALISVKAPVVDFPPRDDEDQVLATPTQEEQPPSVADDFEAELFRQVERWKGFYRLKEGEISALSSLFRLSHALGSSECYVKMHKLAEASNLTYRYCQKVIRSLEQLGWIVKIKDYDASTQMGVLYQINQKPSE